MSFFSKFVSLEVLRKILMSGKISVKIKQGSNAVFLKSLTYIFDNRYTLKANQRLYWEDSFLKNS
jgi:hypothetical protein